MRENFHEKPCNNEPECIMFSSFSLVSLSDAVYDARFGAESARDIAGREVMKKMQLYLGASHIWPP